jgi:hypothetical protein
MTHDVLGPTQTRLSIVVESALRKKREQGMRRAENVIDERQGYRQRAESVYLLLL